MYVSVFKGSNRVESTGSSLGDWDTIVKSTEEQGGEAFQCDGDSGTGRRGSWQHGLQLWSHNHCQTTRWRTTLLQGLLLWIKLQKRYVGAIQKGYFIPSDYWSKDYLHVSSIPLLEWWWSIAMFMYAISNQYPWPRHNSGRLFHHWQPSIPSNNTGEIGNVRTALFDVSISWKS